VSRAIAFRWPLYVFEGAELALFMIWACLFSVILFDPSFKVQNGLPERLCADCRRLMGASMGATAVLIIHSSRGKGACGRGGARASSQRYNNHRDESETA
jgi:aquaporin Z